MELCPFVKLLTGAKININFFSPIFYIFNVVKTLIASQIKYDFTFHIRDALSLRTITSTLAALVVSFPLGLPPAGRA